MAGNCSGDCYGDCSGDCPRTLRIPVGQWAHPCASAAYTLRGLNNNILDKNMKVWVVWVFFEKQVMCGGFIWITQSAGASGVHPIKRSTHAYMYVCWLSRSVSDKVVPYAVTCVSLAQHDV